MIGILEWKIDAFLETTYPLRLVLLIYNSLKSICLYKDLVKSLFSDAENNFLILYADVQTNSCTMINDLLGKVKNDRKQKLPLCNDLH